ncbi:glycoside hydrolase family protein [Pontiella sulfatireligans]|uniref:Iota-carrageenase n=1 Tax=Pontiella sulfatireligans TaxID=2750658 RepID=A0A6C2UGS2_9BACT|nr:hypothetical protein [Pontiella sulfatireligans]VGO18564.1 Iota-carrageenase [Pontiella sulfatireligans]
MRTILWIIAVLACTSASQAEYVETMQENGKQWNLQKDFGLVDNNAKSNQSELLQKAIDDVSAKGGGRLIMPKGTYKFAGVFLNSNVHLLIEKDTVIKPYWPKGTKAGIFTLSTKSMDKGHIENVSIRGMGGSFIVDYSDRERDPNEGCRAINCRQVKNFLLSDILIKDSWTKYCSVNFTPSKADDAREWEVFRPTDGLVKNLKSTDSSSGYGLLQMHAGDTIHFENLWTSGGGVCFRLETGGGGENGGIDNITAKNIYCENGLSAVLMGPHKSQNGMVVIDGVTANSCATGVTMGPGFVEKRNLDNPNYKPGRFADGSTVKNVHVIFGTNAPISLKGIGNVPKEYLDDLRWGKTGNNRLRGPSMYVVKDLTGDSWTPVIKNVTSEGFKYNDGIVVGKKEPRANYREILKGYPVLGEIPENHRSVSSSEQVSGKAMDTKKKSEKKKKK